MRTLCIPPNLAKEFGTVAALWHSDAETRRVDALLLSWVKHEKQLRRLFCFLVFQHDGFNKQAIDGIISVLVERWDLSPEVFQKAIGALGVKSVPGLLGQQFDGLSKEMHRIRLIRNKLMHGQITGKKITSAQLERDVGIVVDWISTLAAAADGEFGYDGVRRNTFFQAKATSRIAVQHYPFSSPETLRTWLVGIIKKVKNARNRYPNPRRGE